MKQEEPLTKKLLLFDYLLHKWAETELKAGAKANLDSFLMSINTPTLNRMHWLVCLVSTQKASSLGLFEVYNQWCAYYQKAMCPDVYCHLGDLYTIGLKDHQQVFCLCERDQYIYKISEITYPDLVRHKVTDRAAFLGYIEQNYPQESALINASLQLIFDNPCIDPLIKSRNLSALNEIMSCQAWILAGTTQSAVIDISLPSIKRIWQELIPKLNKL